MSPFLVESIKIHDMVFLGIDCGTQSLKVLAWDPENSTFESASQSYGLLDGLPPGHKEQHPSTWIDALETCMTQLKANGVRLDAVSGIGVSGQQHGLVTLDAKDQVIRPAKLWNDTSTESQCREIMEAAGGPERYRDETGNSLPPGFTASKILWIRENEPDNYRRIKSLLLPHDYLNFHLTGEKVAEAGDASGTGYFNVRKREWSELALRWIDDARDLRTNLPRLITSEQPAGSLRPALAQAWGMSPRVIVSSGGGDNMMGAIGSGNVKPGILTVSLGTSGTLFSHSSLPVIDPQGDIAAFCSSTGGWLPLGCTMNVTVATEMIRKGFVGSDFTGFDKAIESVPPGSEGLLLVPYLEGERMPPVPDGTGTVLGLRPGTASPAHLARAAVEGVTMGLRYGLDRLIDLGLSPGEIRLIGGGAKSPAWRHIAANIFKTSVVSPANEEGPAFGAALQAMWCIQRGRLHGLTDQFVVLNESTRQTPCADLVSIYEELYRIYRKFSTQLIEGGVFESHRRFIERH